MSKVCFGSISMFCADCDVCKDCPEFAECAKNCRNTIAELANIGDVSKVLKNHEKIMAKLGLIEDKSKRIKAKTKKAEFTLTEGAVKLQEELKARQMISDGWLSDNIEESPEYFQIVVNDLKMYGKRTSGEIVKNLQYKLPPQPSIEKFALMYAAWSVQVLTANNIVTVTTNKKEQIVKWNEK